MIDENSIHSVRGSRKFLCRRMYCAFVVQAKKEGNAELVDQINRVSAAAMQAVNTTLRPEIQLLNNLLSTNTAADVDKVCGAGGGAS